MSEFTVSGVPVHCAYNDLAGVDKYLSIGKIMQQRPKNGPI